MEVDVKERNHKYYLEHREAMLLRARKRREEQKSKVLEILGARCSRCGLDDSRVLCVDHVNGGGTKERRDLKGWHKLIKKVLGEADSGKYQLLCANCNMIKVNENRECYGDT